MNIFKFWSFCYIITLPGVSIQKSQNWFSCVRSTFRGAFQTRYLPESFCRVFPCLGYLYRTRITCFGSDPARMGISAETQIVFFKIYRVIEWYSYSQKGGYLELYIKPWVWDTCHTSKKFELGGVIVMYSKEFSYGNIKYLKCCISNPSIRTLYLLFTVQEKYMSLIHQHKGPSQAVRDMAHKSSLFTTLKRSPFMFMYFVQLVLLIHYHFSVTNKVAVHLLSWPVKFWLPKEAFWVSLVRALRECRPLTAYENDKLIDSLCVFNSVMHCDGVMDQGTQNKAAFDCPVDKGRNQYIMVGFTDRYDFFGWEYILLASTFDFNNTLNYILPLFYLCSKYAMNSFLKQQMLSLIAQPTQSVESAVGLWGKKRKKQNKTEQLPIFVSLYRKASIILVIWRKWWTCCNKIHIVGDSFFFLENDLIIT